MRLVRDCTLPLANQVAGLRYVAVRELPEDPEFDNWSFAHIIELRPRQMAPRGLY